jgi:beta-glucanase (GH16 family)
MKIKITLLLFTIVQFSFFGKIQGQTMQWNEKYAETIFIDTFPGSSLDRNKWNVAKFKRDIGLLIDSSATIKVDNGKLELTMISCPNCEVTNGITYYGNYAGAEVVSKVAPFQYGIFECKAKYATNLGSWPAFWVIGGDGTLCPPGGYGNEIDIAELKCQTWLTKMGHVIHRYYPPVICTESNSEVKDIDIYNIQLNNIYYDYKCIWTPNKISYYINNSLMHEVQNTGQEWYPNLHLVVALSQQIITASNISGQFTVVTPQTTYFDNVRVKRFFATPVITCSDLICTSTTATLGVDPAASNFTWSLTPTNLFSGDKTGAGKTVSITAASGANGQGKITYTFKMPSNEIFTAEKTFWVGKPVLTNMTINGSLTFPSEVCKGKIDIFAAGLDANYTEPVTYIWSGSNVGITGSTNSVWVKYTGSVNSYASVTVTVSGQCGQWSSHCTWSGLITNCGGDDETYRITPNETVLEDSTSFDESALLTSVSETETKYKLTLTPNPAHMETILKIECVSAEETFDENEAWDLEIYTQSQLLKNRKTKLKGQSTNITIAGWQEGVYVVRVKYGNIILQEKLLVK